MYNVFEKHLKNNVFEKYTPKNSKYKKLIWARLGVSRLIYVNIDSPNLGFPYFNCIWKLQLKYNGLESW